MSTPTYLTSTQQQRDEYEQAARATRRHEDHGSRTEADAAAFERAHAVEDRTLRDHNGIAVDRRDWED